MIPTHDSHDESLPLLDTERQQPSSHLPVRQLIALCTIRLADPIAFTQIFPYVNEMIQNLGIAKNTSQTGFYSGIVESIFACTQLLAIYPWASISDKIGRRPVVLASTLGIAMASLCLGFSSTFSAVLFARCLAGFFSGTVAVTHSVLAEMTNPSNQALAYPIFGLCWPLGVIIGPLVGGALSNPTTKYSYFSNLELFIVFPYLLPCLAVAGMTLIAAVVGSVFLAETHPGKVEITGRDYPSTYGSVARGHVVTQTDGSENEKLDLSASFLLSRPVIRDLCTSGCALSFVGTAFDVVFVLFCYSPVQSGGLSFSVSQIGFALSLAGISSATIQVFVLPQLLNAFSCATLYKICMAIWPLAFLFLPTLNSIAKSRCHDPFPETECEAQGTELVLWIGIGVVLLASRVACLAYSFNMILVKEHSPCAASLGSVNGLAQVAQCLARAIAPTFVSCLFALSVRSGFLGGHAWTIVMAMLSIFAWLLSVSIPEMRASTEPGRAPVYVVE